jgi:hypothetical protein
VTDHCLEWMRLLCSSNGKLELKKNAATGYWGSVNRIASLSRHQSFLATAPLSAAIAAANSGVTASSHGGERTRRMTRQDAARKYAERSLVCVGGGSCASNLAASAPQADLGADHEPQEHDGLPLNATDEWRYTFLSVPAHVVKPFSEAQHIHLHTLPHLSSPDSSCL